MNLKEEEDHRCIIAVFPFYTTLLENRKRTIMNTHGESSSSALTPSSSTRRSQQHYGLSESRSIIRQTPPSAFRTPSQRGHRSYAPQPQHHSNRSSFDSPFTSPPPGKHERRLEPLVLDPQKPTQAAQSESVSSTHSRSSSVPVVHQLLEAATRGIRDHASPALVVRQNNYNLHATPALEPMEYQAAILAKSSTQAGFLQKLGANIPEFKRRFFVLKPESNLFYFLSPNDTEPRGKIDLEGSTIEEVEHAPDGRYRFAISWDKPESRRIVLEARSKEIGKEWIQHLEYERVSTLKDKVDNMTSETEANRNRIKDLERQVENFRMVEKDRDGALEDARKWKLQFERLDEALRLLTQRIRKPPPPLHDETKPLNLKDDNYTKGEEKKESNPSDDMTPETEERPSLLNNHSEKAKSALLDEMVEEDVSHDIEEIMEVPGTYFSGLSNAFQQQRESLRLASVEAATAVEDVHEANEKLETMKKRMEKAEKSLCKLWEENCTIRKALKQKKREKRVLVREVKALQQLTKELNEGRPRSRGASPGVQDEEVPLDDTLIGSDNERLIIELEEHVASSILLHERLLAANTSFDAGAEADLNTSMEGSDIVKNLEPIDAGNNKYEANSKIGTSSLSNNGGRQSPLRPTALQPKLMSLLDDESASESDEDEDVDGGLNGYQSMTPSLSTTGAEMGDDCGNSISSRRMIRAASSEESTPERPSPERKNPILQLDEEEQDEFDRQPNLCSASTQSFSSKSVITDNGQATSRLVCPLVDVVETKAVSEVPGQSTEGLQVYHLTFYSKKIGIQFQKAPPAPRKPKGLLTAAMTADLARAVDDSEKTASELRNVASISSWAKDGHDTDMQEFCPIATPDDIVLVCGFQGFDDSGMNKRPQLGARLVAFDGISVEIGHWTFDSIRKAIKARGRPLTLSFRNDYLTSEQRTVLTKAVMEVDAKGPPPRHAIQYSGRDRPPSTTPSITSALSHETEHFVNDEESQNAQPQSDECSTPATGSTCCNRRAPPTSNSISTHRGRTRRFSGNSVSTHQSNFRSFSEAGSNFRSFSEAGSSSVISATLAPLVSNLMKGVSDRKEKFQPDYLHREPEKLEDTPQHKDFQSNLL